MRPTRFSPRVFNGGQWIYLRFSGAKVQKNICACKRLADLSLKNCKNCIFLDELSLHLEIPIETTCLSRFFRQACQKIFPAQGIIFSWPASQNWAF